MTERMTLEQYNAAVKTGQFKAHKSRVNSYKPVIDGHKFDSQSEADIYCEFKLDPEITIIELQPFFEVQLEFELRGKKHQAITWTPDFLVEKDRCRYVVDVKSKGTIKANSKSWPMRKKMFLKNYPMLALWLIIIDNGKRTDEIY